MERIDTDIDGLYLIKPNLFYDDRGYFYESYNKKAFEDIGLVRNFVQDNESLSKKGTIRALHFQEPPYAQLKLVRVVKGSVFDVAVDLREGSPTYGKWYGTVLSEQNKLMFWIPEGFAHGFQALEDDTIFQYKCSAFYNKKAENSIIWNDPVLNIKWLDIPPIVAEKDTKAKFFAELISPFKI